MTAQQIKDLAKQYTLATGNKVYVMFRENTVSINGTRLTIDEAIAEMEHTVLPNPPKEKWLIVKAIKFNKNGSVSLKK